MKKTQTIAVLLAMIMASSMFAAFAISPASSGGTSGGVSNEQPEIVGSIIDEGSTYKTYKGYGDTPKHNYTWQGDTIKVKVKVSDRNGLADIKKVEFYIDDLEKTCVSTSAPINDTMAYYTLTYFVPSRDELYGKKTKIKVRVIDTEDAASGYAEQTINLWFNPLVSVRMGGCEVSYNLGNPGDIVNATEEINSNLTSECGDMINGSYRAFEIDGTCHNDDQAEDYMWTTSVYNADTWNTNIHLQLSISSTYLAGAAKAETIPVTNQYFFMNSSESDPKSKGILTSTAVIVDELKSGEYNYFDFYLKYPAVPKDTYRGAINFAVTAI